MTNHDKHTAPAAIWATYVRSDIAALTPESLSFIYALLGADTWLEAAAVWDRNPDQRKAARAAIAKATGRTP